MSQVVEVLAIVGLFMLRVGVPVMIVLIVGTLIERAYSRREAQEAERPIPIDLPVKTGQEEEELVTVERERTQNSPQ